MIVEIRCPLNNCGEKLRLAIDTGDPSVGIFGSYLEEVDGECPHVAAINMCIAGMGAEAFEESMWGKALLNTTLEIKPEYLTRLAAHLAERLLPFAKIGPHPPSGRRE